MLTPPGLTSLSDAYYLQQQALARETANGVQTLWRDQPKTNLKDRFAYWRTAIPSVADLVARAQYGAATGAAAYVKGAALVQGVTLGSDVPDIDPEAFLADSWYVQEGAYAAMAYQASLLVKGAPAAAAERSALASLLTRTISLVQDAGREASGVSLVVNPGLDGYFRRLRLPSCSRCAVLAGGYYKHNADFDRHERCDCTHVPAAEHYDDGVSLDAEEAIRRGQVTGLSQADRRAILDDGADVSQVINAKRKTAGLSTPTYLGKVGNERASTLESTTRRGVFHHEGQARLTPAAIYKAAGKDRSKARDLLAHYGYLA